MCETKIEFPTPPNAISLNRWARSSGVFRRALKPLLEASNHLAVVGNQDHLDTESNGPGEHTGCFHQPPIGLSSTGIHIPTDTQWVDALVAVLHGFPPWVAALSHLFQDVPRWEKCEMGLCRLQYPECRLPSARATPPFMRADDLVFL